ncbi:MAG: hypothetical protein IJK66_04775 [Bacilli bacterium]|nr:hypothetical protein [Bacilli bacterium]
MMSLQVVTPHIKCIFDCPFCISKGHIHNNKFINNYLLNYNLWENNLINVIKNNNDLKYIVITGTNEPMQSKDYVNDVIDIIRKVNSNIQIEIQTHYYKEDDIYNKLDVVAYSVSNVNLLDKIKPIGNIQRYVIIMTDSFNGYDLDSILKLIPRSVKQITFKKLIDSNGVNEEMDKYILNHSIDNNTLKKLKEDIDKYNGNLSIRLDLDCMNSINRYKIFREDGNLYDNWEEVSND